MLDSYINSTALTEALNATKNKIVEEASKQNPLYAAAAAAAAVAAVAVTVDYRRNGPLTRGVTWAYSKLPSMPKPWATKAAPTPTEATENGNGVASKDSDSDTEHTHSTKTTGKRRKTLGKPGSTSE